MRGPHQPSRTAPCSQGHIQLFPVPTHSCASGHSGQGHHVQLCRLCTAQLLEPFAENLVTVTPCMTLANFFRPQFPRVSKIPLSIPPSEG